MAAGSRTSKDDPIAGRWARTRSNRLAGGSDRSMPERSPRRPTQTQEIAAIDAGAGRFHKRDSPLLRRVEEQQRLAIPPAVSGWSHDMTV